MEREDLEKWLSSGTRKVHLVGIGGSGMSGLALLLLQQGHLVSGSDWGDSDGLVTLEKLGVRCYRGHAAAHIDHADFVTYSSAISPDNPELQEATRRNIPVVRRARTLAALMGSRQSVVISGTHGKTTTTSMIAHILKASGKGPSYYVGAWVPCLAGNAALGSGDVFVVESDESDGSMNEFTPDRLVILNVEAEHLDYYENLDAIERSFAELAAKTRATVYICANDPTAKKIGSSHPHVVEYGVEDGAWRATQLEIINGENRFQAVSPQGDRVSVALTIPGKHNVSNALAALAVCRDLGVTLEESVQALKSFSGAARRFHVLYQSNNWMVVDDYAHHPTEVAATLSAARQMGRKRLVAVFQPHRFTRTRLMYREFGDALRHADQIYVTDVYASSETPISGVTGECVAKAIEEIAQEKQGSVIYEPELDRMKEILGSHLQSGDLVLLMGAGNISRVSRALAAELRVADEIQQICSNSTVVRRYEPMARRTTLRVGGSAKLWVEPGDEVELGNILKFCAEKRQVYAGKPEARHYAVTLIGRGSNLLVRDAGISGVTIHLGNEHFRSIRIEGERLIVGAGARLKQVVMEARKNGLTGIEFLEGIPGSIGGALWMNAGAMGGNLFDVVEKVRMMNMQGDIIEREPSKLDVRYRACMGLRQHVALSAVLKVKRGEQTQIDNTLRDFEKRRWSSQPAAASAGCIFRNPEGIPAGKLIDDLGLKGTCIGKARVSQEHGNFIVNDGGATAGDVLHLISVIQDRARTEKNIQLETEVIICGDESW